MNKTIETVQNKNVEAVICPFFSVVLFNFWYSTLIVTKLDNIFR